MMMVRIAPLAIAATALLATMPEAAIAQAAPQPTCQLRVEPSMTNWVVHGYDPFSADQPAGSFDVTFINDGTLECRFRPIFTLDQEPFGLQSGSSRRVPYTLFDVFSQYDATPRSGRSLANVTRREVVIAPHGQQIVRYNFSAARQSIPRDGLFTQNLEVVAEDSSGNVIGGRQLILGVEVQPSVLMGLSGAFRQNQGRALVDLGDLSHGIGALPLKLYVQSTRGYTVSLESQNAGQLKLQGTSWAIPYQLSLGDRAVPLTGVGTYLSPSGSGAVPDSLPLRFVVEDTRNMRAGTYSDVITITIEVN
jgi:hypothetical protein